MASTAMIVTDFKEPLGKNDNKWNIVIDDANINRSHTFEENSAEFMEQRPIFPLHVSVEIGDVRWVVKDSGQFIMQEGFIVKGAYFHDNFKSNEMDDAVINCVLVCQQSDIYTLSKDGSENLDESDEV